MSEYRRLLARRLAGLDDTSDGEDGGGVSVGAGETFAPSAALPDWASNMRSTRPPKGAPFGFNELQWGRQRDIFIRNLGAVGVYTSGPQEQLGQVTEPRARVWSLDLSLEWVNFQTAVGAEVLRAQFIIQNGVGSGKLNRAATVSVNGTLSIAVLNVPVVPAATIYISVALDITTLGAGPRPDILGRVGFVASPYVRGD